MTAPNDELEVLKKLLVNEHDVVKELSTMVDKIRSVFQIETPSGRIIFINSGRLTDPQRIVAFLAGKYFATKLALIHNEVVGIAEIAKEVGRPATALSGPLKDLTKKGLVEKTADKKYRIAYNRIREIVDMLPKS